MLYIAAATLTSRKARPHADMKPRLAILLAVSLAFFTVAGVWEWRYYAADRPPGTVWEFSSSDTGSKRAEGVAGLTAGPSAGQDKQYTVSALPRKLATGLQSLVEADFQLPMDLSQGMRVHQQDNFLPKKQSLSGAVHTATKTPKRLQRALENPAIILFCYNRAQYLNRTLASLSELPGLQDFALYLSQDGNDPDVASVADSFVDRHLHPPYNRIIEHWQRARTPLLAANQPGHAWLAQHYKWGLDRVFVERNHSHAIIVEDDMLFSTDFLVYFQATAGLLEEDPSIWCISSWNDNGLSSLDWQNNRLFRTSYFPGLGWMLRRQLWEEIGSKFPLQAWDHWMRLDSTAKGRECVSPEINRNKNIGERGANMQMSVFKRYLAQMAWSREPITNWGDLSYLLLPNYTAHLRSLLSRAKLWDQQLTARAIAVSEEGQIWLIPYKGENYLKLARMFRIWPFPRGHHRNLAVMPYKGSTYVLADQRFCTLLPDELRVYPNPTLQPSAGPVHRSCDDVCSDIGLSCRTEDFWFINTCEELQKHFPCEKGCAVELGFDVPNYVVNANLSTYQACLVTQKEPRCSAAHPDTRRLCPCSQ